MQKLIKSFQKTLDFHQYKGFPDFIVLGAQKAGTTALFDYLNEHPGILPSKIKEVHFFDRLESRSQGSDWYLRHFPSSQQKQRKAAQLGYRPLSGEATGAYLFHPHVPKLLSQFCITFDYQPRFIILLRNPVDRALSHYAHNCRVGGREPLSFHDAILAEESRIADDLRQIQDDPDYHPVNLLRYSYAHRGLYMEQIERWLQYFHTQHFMFINSSELLNQPKLVVNQVFAFLGLPAFDLSLPVPKHVGNYEKKIEDETRAMLRSKFDPDSEKIFAFLNQRLWNLERS